MKSVIIAIDYCAIRNYMFILRHTRALRDKKYLFNFFCTITITANNRKVHRKKRLLFASNKKNDGFILFIYLNSNIMSWVFINNLVFFLLISYS